MINLRLINNLFFINLNDQEFENKIYKILKIRFIRKVFKL